MIKDTHHEDFDVARAAQLEINWWSVHRKLFGNAENQKLVDALANLYVEAYGVDSPKLKEAAQQRAMGMLYSDLWVNEGKVKDSPLLTKEEEALYNSYTLLKEAIGQEENGRD